MVTNSLGEYLGKEKRDKDQIKTQFSFADTAAFFQLYPESVKVEQGPLRVKDRIVNTPQLKWNDGSNWNAGGSVEWNETGSFESFVVTRVHNPNNTYKGYIRSNKFINTSSTSATVDTGNHRYVFSAGQEVVSDYIYADTEGISSATFTIDTDNISGSPDLYLGTDETPPLGYWTLDEGSGTTASDSSTNGNDFIITGNANWTSGQYGSALFFDGDTRATTSEKLFGTTGESFTIAFWANASGSNAKMFDDSGAVWVEKFFGGINFEAHFEPDYSEGYGITTNTGSGWNHICCVHSKGSYARVYIDGKREENFNHSITTSLLYEGGQSTSSVASLGGDPDADGSFEPTNSMNGILDDIQLYGRALSDDEVYELYNTQRSQKLVYQQVTNGTEVNFNTPTNKLGFKISSSAASTVSADTTPLKVSYE